GGVGGEGGGGPGGKSFQPWPLSPARASSVGGTSRPSALAVLIAWHPRALPAKFVEQFPRPPQIVRAEAVRKPIGDRGQQLNGLLSVTPLCPEAGQAGRRPEVPRPHLLASRHLQHPSYKHPPRSPL